MYIKLDIEILLSSEDCGSDEDFLMEDDEDSDYGASKKKTKKMVKKSKLERKEKKMPKPRLKATVVGTLRRQSCHCPVQHRSHSLSG